MEKVGQVQENQTQLGESEGAEFSGSTFTPPAFSLTAGGPGAPNGDDKPVQKKDDPLKVDKGQVTFDAEGNDVQNSKWYSRHIHWPGTDSSGVTIGRGYDMGRRSSKSILAHMTTAGITGSQASLLASSAGKRGEDAKIFVNQYRDKIGDITQEQQKKLFEIVYVEYEAKAKGRASKFGAYAQLDSDKPHMLTPEQYDALHPIIKELLVDLTYRGDYRSTGHAAYKNVNPILKEDISDVAKMEKQKTLLTNYKNGLKKGHFMISRTDARIGLLDTGIAGGATGKVDLKKDEGTETKEVKEEKANTSNDPAVDKTADPTAGEATTNDYASAPVWDKHSENRMVGLHPSVAASARALINKADKELGIKLRVPPQGGFRSFKEQDELKKKGVSTVGGGYSFHNYGMAIDVVEIKDGQALWNNPRWEEIAAVGRSLGFEWGGDWKGFIDKPHFQMTFGYTTKQLITMKKGDDGFVDLGDKDDNALKATDSVPSGGVKTEGEDKSTGESTGAGAGRVPKGRLIGAGVGYGGQNHPDDVKAVKEKLFAIGVLTNANIQQYMGNDEETMGQLIKMYQRRIFKNTEDGNMSAGGATETKLIQGVKGTDPAQKPKPASKPSQNAPTSSPKPVARPAAKAATEPDYSSIASQVYNAMAGWGTDEAAVYGGLAKLKKNSTYIAAFKKVYKDTYGIDIVTQIKSEFSNTYMFGNELDKALSYLKAGAGKKPVKKDSNDAPAEFKNIDNVMGREDWRTQNPSPSAANQKYEDSESGWTACKTVAEKMVYRAIYEDLPEDFKRSQVLEAPGKYDYIVGGTGAGEFLSVQKEDKSQVKNIIPKQHKESTFKTSGTASMAIDYMSGYLDQGIPVVAGVDHTFNRSLSKSEGKTSSKNTYGYNEGTTDHFITIVGQGMENGKRYFKWFDPGTQHQANATSDGNKLIEVAPNKFVGSQPWGDKTYTLSMVVLFKKDLKTYKSYVDQNVSDLAKLKSDFNNKKGDFAE